MILSLRSFPFMFMSLLCLTALISSCNGLSFHENFNKIGRLRQTTTTQQDHFLQNRRAILQGILTISSTTFITPPTNAVTDEGLSAVTDSELGKSFRRSAIKGAQMIDAADEKWERFSDRLRDVNKCDENTGRRLFDNGFRKDGTRVGNPVLGALCKPEPLQPLDMTFADMVLEQAVQSALKVGAAGGDADALNKSIQQVESLVAPSFNRDMSNAASEEQRLQKELNFATYAKLRALSNSLNTSSRKFEIEWGKALLGILAPNANRDDYFSPFPEMKDEFEDFDYDKGVLLDGLGKLKISLDKMKAAGLIGYYEISIPYDDYGSVVTVAIDDYQCIGSEMLLQDQSIYISGIGQALVRAALDGKVLFGLDQFFIDPSTTKQSEYNPTQLLLSLNNLRKP